MKKARRTVPGKQAMLRYRRWIMNDKNRFMPDVKGIHFFHMLAVVLPWCLVFWLLLMLFRR
jgi:hypothetical protein